MRATPRDLRGSCGGEEGDVGGSIVLLMGQAQAMPVDAFRHGQDFSCPCLPMQAGRQKRVVLLYHGESSAMQHALQKDENRP